MAKIVNGMSKVPEIYEDGLKSSVQESGKVLSLIPKTVNAALAPLRKWIAQREYNVAETEKLLALKLEKIDPDSIVSPEPYIAVPALQAISYCDNSEDLRNMYANLLASSMRIDKKQNVHPSYVELIKQLSPDEAKLLKRISDGSDSYPLIDVKLVLSNNGGYFVQVQNFTLLAEGFCEYPERVCEYLDNLSRLKIIDIPYGVYIKSDEVYKPLESNIKIQNIINSEVSEGDTWKIDRKKLEITEFGKGFIEACVKGK